MTNQLPTDITAAINVLLAYERACMGVGGNSFRQHRDDARAALEDAILKLADENARLREEWAQEGIGWLRDKDIDCLMGVEDENKRLTAENGRLRAALAEEGREAP